MQPLSECRLRFSRGATFPVSTWLRATSLPKPRDPNLGWSRSYQHSCRYGNRPSAYWSLATGHAEAPCRSRFNVTIKDFKVRTSSTRHSSASSSTEPSSPPSKDGSPSRELPSQSEHRRSLLSKRATHLMDNLQSNIFIAGQRLNDLTGYSGIEALKQDIENQEARVASTRAALQAAKDAYTTSISQRSASQREVNELLQRKHAWSPPDLERFTALYRSDHANEVAETTAQADLMAAERAAEEAANQLSGSILKRYHEEQIWSDKIRRMSTWGTWGLMGVNVLLFLVFQWALEPWRRGRLVKGFEEKVRAVLEGEREREGRAREGEVGAVQPVGEQRAVVEDSRTGQAVGEDIAPAGGLDLDTTSSTPIVEAPETLEPEVSGTSPDTDSPTPIQLSLSHPSDSLSALFHYYTLAVQHLFSTNLVSLRQVDLTSARIEGAMAGVAFASIIAALVRATR